MTSIPELLLKVKKIVEDTHTDRTGALANLLINGYKTSKKHYLNLVRERLIIALRNENEEYYKLITSNQKAKEKFEKRVDKKAMELAVMNTLRVSRELRLSDTGVQLEFLKFLASTDREALPFALNFIERWQPPPRFQEQKEHDVERDLWRRSHDQ